jgi:putative ABC transport system substrate-binding protein
MWYKVLWLAIAAVMSWPLAVSAQQPGPPVVGFLTSGSSASLNKQWIAAFHRGLMEFGYVDGQNLTIEYRGADDYYERLSGLAAELVSRQVAVIVAAGGPVSALAAKRATATIPIVFTTVADPVKSGLVASINRPGGNVTGTAGLTSELDPKRLELLHQLKPSARAIGVLINPNRPGVDAQLMDLQAAANKIGPQLIIQKAGTGPAIDIAFETLAQQRADALVVTADPLFNFRRAQVVALAARYMMPAIYQWREFVTDGGLMSYGPSIAEAYYQTGVYAARILKGAKPAELPVVQPAKFELVINLKTATTLGIEVPSTLLARVNEVIE